MFIFFVWFRMYLVFCVVFVFLSTYFIIKHMFPLFCVEFFIKLNMLFFILPITKSQSFHDTLLLTFTEFLIKRSVSLMSLLIFVVFLIDTTFYQFILLLDVFDFRFVIIMS